MTPIIAESSVDVFGLDRTPVAVQEFIRCQGLAPDLREAIAVAGGAFDVSEPITLSVEEDPDTGERWIEINVAARGSVEKVMKAHENYTERLLSLPMGSTRQIRLFLHIARD